MKNCLLFFTLFIAGGASVAIDLPYEFKLEKNASNETYIVKNGNLVVHPNIVLIGNNKQYIVGCIEGDEKDIDIPNNVFPGYFILPTNSQPNNAGLTQIISKQNWDYFKKKIPGLDKIELNKLDNGDCTYVYQDKSK